MQQALFNVRRNSAARHYMGSLLFLLVLFSALIVGLVGVQPVHAQSSVNCADTATTHIPQAECQALVTFYNSTNGPSWTNRTNWLTATAVDDWQGVTATYGNVTGISLNSNNLSGTIPNLSALTKLDSLSLAYNNLSGSIPNLLGFTNLIAVSLHHNQFTGTIPDMTGLTRLAYLHVEYNQLTSLIPPSIMNVDLAPGNYLRLCGGANIIGSPDPTVIAWVQAHDSTWIQGCGQGTVPTATADSGYTTHLTIPLTVAAPGILGNDSFGTPSAVFSSFGGGSLGGAVTDHAIGSTISPLPGYSDGSLVVNADGGFTFTPPASSPGTFTFQYRLVSPAGYSDGTVTLTIEFCDQTAITGIPQAECEALVNLYKNNNGPGWRNNANWNTATPVSSWATLAVSGGHVTEINMNYNFLTGSFPDLSVFTHLRHLELSVNQLSGPLTDLSALTQLQHLSVSSNQLTGQLPDLSPFTGLQYLWMGDNQFTGTIPALSALTQLRSVDLTWNQLTGTIPDLTGLGELYAFSVKENQLVSVIPSSITSTNMSGGGYLNLCGGSNMLWTLDPTVIAYVQERDAGWTQGCGIGSAPLAADDPDYSTAMNTQLTVNAPSVLANDTVGVPAVALSSFGGGSLGGTVVDYTAGTTVASLPTYSDGSLVVNANGSFVFTPPTGFLGTYTFQYRLNNGVGISDATVTIIVGSSFSIDTGSGFESNTGTITFTVTRTGALNGTSTIQYATANGTATAGSDYVAASDTLIFDDGVTTQTIEIALIGDAVVEADETFFINLSNPTNATIADAQGVGMITNSTVTLRGPATNTLTNDNTPLFKWAAITGAAEYQLQVDNNRNFGSLAFTYTGLATRRTASALSDARYFWRVRACDAADHCGGWSAPVVLTIDHTAPAQPVLLSPAHNATTPDNTPFFRWNAVSGAVQYQLQVDDQGDFTSPVTNITVVAATSYIQPRALADKRYYWRVRAQDKAGNWSAWSARWVLTVNAIPMAQPTLIPTNTPRPTQIPTATATVIPTAVPTVFPTATLTEIVPLLPVVEAEQPIVVQSGVWIAYGEPAASGGSYLLSSTATDTLTMAFAGSEVTVVYIKHPAVGSFAIEVDGVVMQVVDSVAAEAAFSAEATISGLVYGDHTVRVYPVAGVVAIDAFRVELPLEVIIPTPIPTDVPAETPVPTDIPTDIPVETPVPTDIPTGIPTETPVPTDVPTDLPTETPVPTEAPTMTPVPTDIPTDVPIEVVPPAESTEEPAS